MDGNEVRRIIFGSYLSEVWAVPAAVVMLAAMSYFSLRFLRGLPDFPDKPAMLRGAKWGGLVFAGWMVVFATLAGLCIRYTDYIHSGTMLIRFVCCGALFWLLWRYAVEAEGMVACAAPASIRPFDLDKWLAQSARMKASIQRRRWVFRVYLALFAAGCLAMVSWEYRHGDRILAAYARQERLQASLQKELRAPEVQSVLVGEPSPYQPSIGFLWLHVVPDTTSDRAAAIAERGCQALAGRQVKQIVRVVVGPEHGPRLARAYYVPPGMTLPPDADDIHPQRRSRGDH